MSEYVKTINEYPNICFQDSPDKRDQKHSFFQLEAANIIPSNYDINIISQYKKIYTWNGKLFNEYLKAGLNVVKVPNFPLFDNYYLLDNFIPYEAKIPGICLISRYRERQQSEFDISHLRVETFDKIEGMTKHTFGKVPYCGKHYKGIIGKEEKETYPSSKAKLKKLNKYKFNLCFENCWQELWSWDYITEKITDCFKAKTVPVYYGCYNIEERIPKELYVDFREFKDDVPGLVKFLNGINKKKYTEMVEEAFKWEQENKLGNIEELKVYLDND